MAKANPNVSGKNANYAGAQGLPAAPGKRQPASLGWTRGEMLRVGTSQPDKQSLPRKNV